MPDFIMRLFGALTRQYYWRQFVFASFISSFICYSLFRGSSSQRWIIPLVVANTFLYPYSRFVWDSCSEFLFGRNIVFFPVFFWLWMKLLSIGISYQGASVFGSIGLIYLYFKNPRGFGLVKN